MPTLKGVIVNGQTYHFDHEYLDNNPIPAYGCGDNYGRFLAVEDASSLEWRDVLPVWGCSDAHHVLAVNDTGDLGWTNMSYVLGAEDDADVGSVLTIVDSYGSLGWEPASGGESLPTYDTSLSSSDDGKVLSINYYGDLEWMTPSMVPDLPTSGTHDTPYVLGEDGNGNAGWTQIGGMMDSVLHNHYEFDDNYIVDGGGASTLYMLVTAGSDSIWWEQLWDQDFFDSRLLPTYNMDDGKVLMVDNSAPAWVSAPWEDILPSYGTPDIGKVLMVTNGNRIEWVMPS